MNALRSFVAVAILVSTSCAMAREPAKTKSTTATTTAPVATSHAPPTVAPTSTLPPSERLVRLARASVVRVRTSGCGQVSIGTAWMANDGRLVSNWHVVEGGPSHDVSTWDGHDLTPGSIDIAIEADISRISGSWREAPDLRPMTTRSDRIPDGEIVHVLGYPEGNELTVSSGESMGYSYDSDLAPREILKITAPVKHGNSGGPVVDADGRVVGVIYAEEIATGATLVIPIADVIGPTGVPLAPLVPCSA